MSDKILASPSASCYLRGAIHNREPSGTISEVAGVQTYIATPPSDKANGNVILYFQDVFGFFTNGQLIMDGYAEAGYLVLGPDYFRGVCLVVDETSRRYRDSKSLASLVIANQRIGPSDKV